MRFRKIKSHDKNCNTSNRGPGLLPGAAIFWDSVFADAHSVDEKAEVCGGSWLALGNVCSNLVEVGLNSGSLESPLDSKGIKPVNPKGNQSWIFIGRTDAEAEAPIFWPLDGKNWLIRKDPAAGKDWRQEEKGTTEDEMVVWHHRLDGHVFEQSLGVGDGQGSLACYSPWGRKELDITEWLNSLVPELFLSHIAWQTTPNSVMYYELIIILAINFIMLMNFMGQEIEQSSGSLFLSHSV